MNLPILPYIPHPNSDSNEEVRILIPTDLFKIQTIGERDITSQLELRLQSFVNEVRFLPSTVFTDSHVAWSRSVSENIAEPQQFRASV